LKSTGTSVFVLFYSGPIEKVRNAADARRQGEAVYLIMRAVGNEADVVFLTNEKTVIFNNPLCSGISQLARNSLQLNSLFTHINSNKMTECFSVGPIYCNLKLIGKLNSIFTGLPSIIAGFQSGIEFTTRKASASNKG
jgi:hypothetical protein